MTFTDFAPLIGTTLRDPRSAARQVLSLGLSNDVLWTALLLVAAINAMVLQLMIAGAPEGTQAQFPAYFTNPLAVFVLMAGMMVIYIHCVWWAGRAMSGEGPLGHLLALIVWLQVLRTAVQIFILVLGFAAPALAGIVSMIAFAWGVWILLNFVTEALGLAGLGHALIVLILAVIGLVLGVGIMLAVIGALAQGVV